MKTTIITIGILTILLLTSSTYDIYPKGLTTGQTYNYEFNFTTDSTCNDVVTGSGIDALVADAVGFTYKKVDLGGLNQIPSYLCEYRDSALRATHQFGTGIYGDLLTKNISFYEPFVTVTAFGANGNDNAADSHAIQAAVDLCTSRACRIYFPKGIYYINESIEVSKGGYTFIGDGIDSSKIQLANSANVNMFELTRSGSNDEWLLFQNLHLHGGKSNNNKGGGIVATTSTYTIRDIHIDNIFISDFSEEGINLTSAWGFNLRDAIIEFCEGYGVLIQAGNNARIVNNKIMINDKGSIKIEGGDYHQIANNYIRLGDPYPALELGGDFSIVAGNTVDATGDSGNNSGIQIGGDYNSITGNVIQGDNTNIYYGIELNSSAERNSVLGNIVRYDAYMKESIHDSGVVNGIAGGDYQYDGLALQPTATANVITFGNGTIGDTTDGKMLYIYRNAPEGKNYYRFYVNQYQSAVTQSDRHIQIKPGSGYRTYIEGTTVWIGTGSSDTNLTMTSQNGNEHCCGVDNTGTWSCSSGAC